MEAVEIGWVRNAACRTPVVPGKSNSLPPLIRPFIVLKMLRKFSKLAPMFSMLSSANSPDAFVPVFT